MLHFLSSTVLLNKTMKYSSEIGVRCLTCELVENSFILLFGYSKSQRYPSNTRITFKPPKK